MASHGPENAGFTRHPLNTGPVTHNKSTPTDRGLYQEHSFLGIEASSFS